MAAGGADMQRAGPSSLAAGEGRVGDNLVLHGGGGAQGGRSRRGDTSRPPDCAAALVSCY